MTTMMSTRATTTTARPVLLPGAARRSMRGSSAARHFSPVAMAVKRQTTIPAPSYNIPLTLAATGTLSHLVLHNDGLCAICTVLAGFLAFQASRVKFVFDDEALEVVIGANNAESENKFVGGRNRWAYDTFVNWEFWWPGFPVLVYFKETQTKPEGQIHFFPIIMVRVGTQTAVRPRASTLSLAIRASLVLQDGKMLYDVMSERCGSSVNSGGKAW